MEELIAGTIRTATPILLAALGGLICERVGIFNIALEGLMLLGAFFGILGVYLIGTPWAGIGLSCVITLLVAFLFAVLLVKFHSEPTITALGINMLAEGITTFSMKFVFGDQGSVHADSIVGLPKLDIPLIQDIPVIGPLCFLDSSSRLCLFSLSDQRWYQPAHGRRKSSRGGHSGNCSLPISNFGYYYQRCILCFGGRSPLHGLCNYVYGKYDRWSRIHCVYRSSIRQSRSCHGSGSKLGIRRS